MVYETEYLLLAVQTHLEPPNLEEIKIITNFKKVKEVHSDRISSKELPAVPYLWGKD
jgi:hypothetical protein